MGTAANLDDCEQPVGSSELEVNAAPGKLLETAFDGVHPFVGGLHGMLDIFSVPWNVIVPLSSL